MESGSVVVTWGFGCPSWSVLGGIPCGGYRSLWVLVFGLLGFEACWRHLRLAVLSLSCPAGDAGTCVCMGLCGGWGWGLEWAAAVMAGVVHVLLLRGSDLAGVWGVGWALGDRSAAGVSWMQVDYCGG